MRPQVLGEASRREMAQEEFDPLWLMSGVVMLVLEARTPDHSVKGRTEGPHCPNPKKEGRHLCSEEVFECHRAMELRRRIAMMWENGIPTCIDILLFPACTHGLSEAQSLDGAASSIPENFILLERWSIHCIHKWHGEWTEGVGGSMLLQAVRSYLYFSQLSSWLSSMKGCLPVVIACRLYAPGEEARVDFEQKPDSHIFPTGTNGHHGLRVSVQSLPRQAHVPHLLCVLAVQDDAGDSGCGRPVNKSTAKGHFTKKKIERTSLDEKEAFGRQEKDRVYKSGALPAEMVKSPQGWKMICSDQQQESEDYVNLTLPLTKRSLKMSEGGNKEKGSSFLDARQDKVQLQGPDKTELGGSEGKLARSSVRASLESQLKPLSLLPRAAARHLDHHSPKVLMSTEFQLPKKLVTKKKRMDFESVDGIDGGQLIPSLDQSLFFANQLPLAAEEMQKILANLQCFGQPVAGLPACPVPLKLEKGSQRAIGYPGSAQNCARFDVSDCCYHKDHSSNGSLSTFRNYVTSVPPPATSSSPESEGFCHTSENLQKNSGADLPDKELGKIFSELNLEIPPDDADTCSPEAAVTCMSQTYSYSKASHLSINELKMPDDKDFTERRTKHVIKSSPNAQDGLTCKRTILLEHEIVNKRNQEKEQSDDGPLSLPSSKLLSRNCPGANMYPPSSSQVSPSLQPCEQPTVELTSQTRGDVGKILDLRPVDSSEEMFSEIHLDMTAKPFSSSSSSAAEFLTSSSGHASGVHGLGDKDDENSDSSTPTNQPSSPLTESPLTSCLCPMSEICDDKRGQIRASASHGISLILDDAGTRCMGGKEHCRTEWVHKAQLPDLSTFSSTMGTRKSKKDNKCLEEDAASCNFMNVSDTSGSLWDDKNLVFKSTSSCECVATMLSLSSSTSCPHLVHSRGLSKHNQRNAVLNQCSLQDLHEDTKLSETARPTCNCLSAASLSLLASKQFFVSNCLHLEEPGALESKVGSNLFSCDSCNFYAASWDGKDDPSKQVKQPQQNICKHTFSTAATTSVTQDESFQRPVFSLPDCDEVFLEDTNCPTSSEAITRFKKHFQDEAGSFDENSDQIWSCNGSVDVGHVDVKWQQHKASLCEQTGEDHLEQQGPARTKSTPNFASLSADSQSPEEKENASSETVTYGHLGSRDKGLVESPVKTSAGHNRLCLRMVKSASMMFQSRGGGLPSQSSPAPIKRRSTGRFDYDDTLTNTRAIKNALSMSRLVDVTGEAADSVSKSGRILSTSAPASTNCLLGNFEESILNGRLEPAGVVDGFTVDIGASGSFCPPHLSLPVTAYFFHLSDDNAPSPYLGHVDLEGIGKKGYHIPRKGTLQVTLFNPNKTVVKMFVVMYDLADMPPHSQTVIRQRTVYMPVDPNSQEPTYLRYLIHLRVASSTSGKIYLHTDVRLIFARNKFELDTNIAQYELRSFTETPVNPKYSPKK